MTEADGLSPLCRAKVSSRRCRSHGPASIWVRAWHPACPAREQQAGRPGPRLHQGQTGLSAPGPRVTACATPTPACTGRAARTPRRCSPHATPRLSAALHSPDDRQHGGRQPTPRAAPSRHDGRAVTLRAFADDSQHEARPRVRHLQGQAPAWPPGALAFLLFMLLRAGGAVPIALPYATYGRGRGLPTTASGWRPRPYVKARTHRCHLRADALRRAAAHGLHKGRYPNRAPVSAVPAFTATPPAALRLLPGRHDVCARTTTGQAHVAPASASRC